MKRTLATLAVTTLGLVGSGCGDFLTAEPETAVAIDFFYQTPEQARLALMGVYDAVQDVYGGGEPSYFFLTELATDNMVGADGYNDVDRYDWDAGLSQSGNVWDDSYAAIAQANILLDRLGALEAPEETKTPIEAEARFLRALNYWNLVRLFGDVPLITQPIDGAGAGEIGRTPEADVHAQVAADMEFAAQNLPAEWPGSEVGRATSGAAYTILGAQHLWRDECEAAAEDLVQVINSGQYRLLDDFADVFDYTNANHAESILEVQFLSDDSGEGINLPFKLMPRAVIRNFGNYPSSGQGMPFEDVKEAFDTTSARYLATLDSDLVDDQGNLWDDVYIRKIEQDLYSDFQSGFNWMLYRYADVLLMYAEALGCAGGGPTAEAYEAVNQVRRRAYGLPTDAPSDVDLPQGLSQEAFQEAVLEERRVELAFEGHRWYDLVRTEQLTEEINAKLTALGLPPVAQECHRRYPIPQSEIEVNPAISLEDQNECYR